MYPRFSLMMAVVVATLWAPTAHAQKEKLYESIDRRADACWETAQAIWRLAEPGYQETESSALLAAMLDEAGFQIEHGVAGMPTAFTATFGAGQPVIGLLGEFDALPGLSQDTSPQRVPREAGGYGHGCGHHLS